MNIRYTTLSLMFALCSLVLSAEPHTQPRYVQGTTLQGTPINTQGKVTYLKFWATWCRYCVEEMPHLEHVFKNRDPSLTVVSINIGLNQSEELVKRFLDKHHYQVDTLFDHDGSLTRRFNVIGTPTHLLLDEQGNEIYRSALLDESLKRALSAYLPKEQNHD
ncbi:TlpA disulfide reductase family protein [Pseudoalteromonas sp. T1lg23B]|uniref:TlpA disulfide reductase family protein n=1 Tax=Pseudoalteromonas sp. T1lg23B TaxID=2077097 RepID=UPI000CF62BA3|nr:TlpA disulfide reductase family protein [Pseudoalteromonas sp. T1lg23B]